MSGSSTCAAGEARASCTSTERHSLPLCWPSNDPCASSNWTLAAHRPASLLLHSTDIHSTTKTVPASTQSLHPPGHLPSHHHHPLAHTPSSLPTNHTLTLTDTKQHTSRQRYGRCCLLCCCATSRPQQEVPAGVACLALLQQPVQHLQAPAPVLLSRGEAGADQAQHACGWVVPAG